jgi:hypothetical protein
MEVQGEGSDKRVQRPMILFVKRKFKQLFYTSSYEAVGGGKQ